MWWNETSGKWISTGKEKGNDTGERTWEDVYWGRELIYRENYIKENYMWRKLYEGNEFYEKNFEKILKRISKQIFKWILWKEIEDNFMKRNWKQFYEKKLKTILKSNLKKGF